MTSVRSGLLVGVLILVLAAVAGSVTLLRAASIARPIPMVATNAMAVDAVAGGSVDAGRTVSDSTPFDISIHVTLAGTEYWAYGVVLEYDSAVINFVPVTTKKVTYVNGADSGLNINATAMDSAAAGSLRRVEMGSSASDAATTWVGEVVKVRYQCVAPGTTGLVMIPVDPGPPSVNNSTTLGAGGVLIGTDLINATVTCEAEATATSTPTATDTPAATDTPTPTETPVPPTDTPTPTNTPVPPTNTPTPTSIPGVTNAMAVDATAGGSVDAGRTVSGSTPFDISIHVTQASAEYWAYGVVLEYDSAVINFVPVTTKKVTYVNSADSGLNINATALDSAAAGSLRRVEMGSSASDAATTWVGEVVQVRYQCVANGTTGLVMIPADPGPPLINNTSTLGAGGVLIDTGLINATVTCEDIVQPTATSTSTATPTRTPTVTPTPTPAYDCVFADNFSRGTQFLVNGRTGQFTGPGIDVSGVRVMRFGSRVLAIDFRSGAVIFGQGTCPNGPGRFQAMRIFPFPLVRWLLQDVTP
jgi:hypothetical protein